MADTKKHIRVFLASPGDLQDERIAAKAIVEHVNRMFSDFEGYHVDLVGWEDTLPRYGRAQAVINQDLDTCELFVGMLWERWGTPPSKDGPYTSGFEEEYELAMANRRQNNRPEICLFLKDMDAKLLRDPGHDTKKVLEFRERLAASKEIKYESFSDIRDFELKIMRAVVAYIQRLVKADREKERIENQATPAEASSSPTINDHLPPDAPLDAAGEAFIREFLALNKAGGEESEISAVHVARLRLLANLIETQGNDEDSLGPHDANLLFSNKEGCVLGGKEITGLVKVGLSHFQSENAPLWYWYSKDDGFAKRWLGWFSLGRVVKVRVGALAAMTLIEEPLREFRDLGRDLFLNAWFAEDAQSQVKVAALNYLAECGLLSDLEKVKAELARGDYQTRDAALDAVIRINLREGRQKAFDELFDLQTDQISNRLCKILFSNREAISDEILKRGISQRNDAIRRECVDELSKRSSLSPETAARLLDDNDAQIRLVAIKTLVKSGKTYSEDEGRKIILRQTSTGLLGLGGQTFGEAQFIEFQRLIRASKTEAELEEASKRASIFDRTAECALMERRFGRDSGPLLRLIDDCYKQTFADCFKQLVVRHGEESQLVKDVKGLEGHLRSKFVRDALDVVLRKSDARGLPFIRRHLADSSLAYSEHDLEYFGEHGEWQDVPLIVSLTARYAAGTSLLSIGDDRRYRLAAKALRRIGKGRAGELLTLEMPSTLLALVIHGIPDREFKALSKHHIESMLSSESERVRKIAALRCVRSFSKARLMQTLKDYITGDKHRYYNVVHWLDFGVSAPREIALGSVAKVLARDRSD
ncbi:DUF4062 domain-containing protein [Pseudorhodoplanes sp.]|uniref:DUF4062 domain-containing protein n=1 Tax=Pseudorhodoplanes sp. TaxID=1934341 RepID=UPI003D0F3A07